MFADIDLPYCKQGCDLGTHLELEPTIGEALEAHAQRMDYVATTLRQIKDIIGDASVEIHAECHMILIEGPDEVIEKLIEADLASPADWLGDDEDDEPCDDPECEYCHGEDGCSNEDDDGNFEVDDVDYDAGQ